MCGVCEAIFEFNFPQGTDMMGKILVGPKPAGQMEAGRDVQSALSLAGAIAHIT